MVGPSIDDLGAATTAFVAQQEDGDTSGVIPGGAVEEGVRGALEHGFGDGGARRGHSVFEHPGGLRGNRVAQAASRTWRLIRANMALRPRSRSGLTTLASPSVA